MKHSTRKLKIGLALSVLAALAIYSVAFAAGTPAWWDNPDGYTSWTETVATGTVANSGDTTQEVLVLMDVINDPIPDNKKEVWAQVEWTVVAGGTGSFETGSNLIRWTNDSCPASTQFPLTNVIGFGAMSYQGPMDSPGPEWGYVNGDELSYSIDIQPQCERIDFPFSVGPNSEIDYRIEVQTLCTTPTAITLQTLSAEPRVPSIWVAALTGGLLILAAGVAVVSRRRVKVANDA